MKFYWRRPNLAQDVSKFSEKLRTTAHSVFQYPLIWQPSQEKHMHKDTVNPLHDYAEQLLLPCIGTTFAPKKHIN